MINDVQGVIEMAADLIGKAYVDYKPAAQPEGETIQEHASSRVDVFTSTRSEP